MKMKRTINIILALAIFCGSSFAQTYTLDSLLSATQMNHPELLKLQEEYLRSTLDVKDAWARPSAKS